jgi:hypothetical protein
MNRRDAINRILLIGGGVFTAFSGYEWFQLNRRRPDLRYLEEQRELLSSLADAVIPRTDTPGAKDANIVDTMMILVTECTAVESQTNFTEGLRSIQSYCKVRYNKSFQDCAADEKNYALARFERRGTQSKITKKFSPMFGRPFFDTLKEVAAIGYCTSELGATQGLSYDPVPGRYVGCEPMAAHQRAWAI